MYHYFEKLEDRYNSAIKKTNKQTGKFCNPFTYLLSYQNSIAKHTAKADKQIKYPGSMYDFRCESAGILLYSQPASKDRCILIARTHSNDADVIYSLVIHCL